MVALAAALLVAFVPQDESRLKEGWPTLVEVWKAVEAYKPAADAGPLDDEYLKLMGRIHGAFESAGLYSAEGEYLPQAMKAFVKTRARDLAGTGAYSNRAQWFRAARIRIVAAGADSAPAETDPMNSLLASLKKLQTLEQAKLDDEENVQEELATARKSLKALGITADETPPALRRRALRLIRALALGEGYPEPATSTEDQAKQFRAWISDMGHESIETREKATAELRKAGEPALPLLREALKSGDAEVAARSRSLLGIGHAPWKTVARPEGTQIEDILIAPAPVLAAPPKATKEEKPK
jgi:hypothetical protein